MKKKRLFPGEFVLFSNQNLLKMKLILLFSCFSVFSMFAANTYSQETKISLVRKDVSVSELLKQIEDVSDFYFAYNNKLIDVERRVNVKAKSEPIKTILNDVFRGTDISYLVMDKQIVLYSESAMKNATPQQAVVTGVVTDEKDEPIPGASIQIKGTTIGVITDLNGTYSIVASMGDVLIFSFVGMKTEEIQVGESNTINIKLETDIIGLDEVVAIGYGTQKKKNVTGAVASIDGEALDRSPVMNNTQALAGMMPGITVVQREGRPGLGGAEIYIRGRTTLGDASPLIVIDGIPNRPGALSYTDPSDIKSITVLKDASASIYGARAANGVILIETKRGSSGPAVINFNANYGLQAPTFRPEMANAVEFTNFINDIDKNYGRQPSFSNDAIAKYMHLAKIPGTILTMIG